MKREEIEIMGIPVVRWIYNGVVADFAVDEKWATLYTIKSSNPGNGYAQGLLRKAKEYYEQQGKKVGGSVALNPTMKHIYKKLGIEEYDDNLKYD